MTLHFDISSDAAIALHLRHDHVASESRLAAAIYWF